MAKIIKRKEKGNNRHWKNNLDKAYLGAHNLEEGEEMELTIVKFEGEEEVQMQDGSKSPKMVLYFSEDVPKMILNITNASTISALYGVHSEQWINKKIRVFAITGKFFGKTQEALRVRDIIPEREVDIVACAEKMNACTKKTELKALWEGWPKSVQNHPELITLKESLKNKLA